MTKRKAIITLLVTVGIAWGSVAALLVAGWSPKLGLESSESVADVDSVCKADSTDSTEATGPPTEKKSHSR